MPNDGTGAFWDEAHPNSADLQSNGPVEITDVRIGARIRLAKEHMTMAAGSVGGEHKAGSALSYIGLGASPPTLRPDGATAFTATDLGRLWFNTTTNQLNALTAVGPVTWTPVAAASANSVKIAILQDQKAAGVNGGTSNAYGVGTWNTRTLNNNVDPSGIILAFNGGAPTAANQFQLGPGTYVVEASAPAFTALQHKARLNNVTDGILYPGSLEFNATSGAYAQTSSRVVSEFVIAANKIFQLEHAVQAGAVNTGLGNANTATFGTTLEVYSIVKIMKIA